ncbi:MAG TPA: transcription termination/antitermination protein NusA [Firmicutes bacterium]|nr:transcription termination/antitermination protein NusA [Bacillota bacterium]
MNHELLDALDELERTRGISRRVLVEAIEAAIVSAYRRNYANAQNVRVELDEGTGQIKVYARRDVVEEVSDPRTEISLSDAREQDPGYQVGDVFETEVTPRDFGRIAAQTAKQVVIQRIREAERDMVYEEYASRIDDIITGVVQRHEQRNVYVDLGRVEAVLTPSEQMPNEVYRHNDRIKVYLMDVKKTTKGPLVLVSRTHPGLLKRLFELEVPEIYDGVVEIRAVAREAGFRSKIAVSSRDPNVDAVGACVGQKGSRVQQIVSELRGEKIDIVAWDPEITRFIANALSPAKVVGVFPNEPQKTARVVVPDSMLSLAIGKEGQNARLAARLTGWKIDIKSESQMAEIIQTELFEPVPEEAEAQPEAAAPAPAREETTTVLPETPEAVPQGEREEPAEEVAAGPVSVDRDLLDALVSELLGGGDLTVDLGEKERADEGKAKKKAAGKKGKGKKESIVLKDLSSLGAVLKDEEPAGRGEEDGE